MDVRTDAASPDPVARVLASFAGAGAVPDIQGKHRLLVALAIDTLGVGLFLPLAFYFFTVTTSLSVTAVGFTMTAATLSALLLSPLGGLATDRWGARRMVVTSNLLSAAGYVSYPFASSYLGIFLCVFLVMTADRLYFASWPTLIARIARVGQLDTWFALVQSVGAGCVGLGSLVSTVLLASGGSSPLKTIAVANACTSLVAAGLTATQKLASAAVATRARFISPWIALSDPVFRRMLLAHLLIAMAWTVPAAFLPLYLTRVLLLPRWCATLVSAANYLLIFFCQLRLTHAVRRIGRIHVIITGVAFIVMSLGGMAAATLASGAMASPFVFGGMVAYTVGEMLVLPSSYALVSAIAPDELRGRYMSMFQITGVVAFGIGPGMVGWLFEIDPLAVLVVVSAFVTAGAGVLFGARHRFGAGARCCDEAPGHGDRK
jgi:MFS family permease